MDLPASQALDEWTRAIRTLAAAVDARETAERFHAEALAAAHPFKSRIARTYSRLLRAIVREAAAEEAEAAARLRFSRARALWEDRSAARGLERPAGVRVSAGHG